jgi:hypothetical protein
MAIVTTAYRYKRPPRKRKAIALEAPAVVTTKNSRRPVLGETAAEVQRAPVQEGTAQSSTPREAARVISPSHHSASPANDDRKPAIVTIKRKSRFGDAPELTPEEHQRRGEAADAMWRGLVDQATAKDGKSAAVSAGASSPATKSAIATTGRKRRNDGPHLPMELPLPASPSSATGTTTSG